MSEDDLGWGIYVHSPWCRVRCPYCAFEVQTDAPRWQLWRDGVIDHLALERHHFEGKARHLYFGGGTPSMAPPELIGQLIAAMPIEDRAEVTVEANPGTIDSALLRGLIAAGVNRLSVGIQTFQPCVARLLARGHTVRQAAELLTLVRSHEDRGLTSWSADLIFAVPDQTIDDLRSDLARLLASEAPHVSVYALSFEPGTPLTRARDKGRIKPPSAAQWSEQYNLVVDTLEHGGLKRYEVSNFARPGHRSQHNGHVWRGGHYMGLGPSAHGFRMDGTRTRGQSGVNEWRKALTSHTERPTGREAAVDLILSTLRHIDGLPLSLLASRTGFHIDRAQLRPHFRRGLLVDDGLRGTIRLGAPGWPVADGLVRAVADALAPSDECPPRQA